MLGTAQDDAPEDRDMVPQFYLTGESAKVGDLVDLCRGNGPRGEIVVLIPHGPAAVGFDFQDWSYLGSGVMIQTEEMGLVFSELDAEILLVGRK
jgi:hypothetical protein